MRVTKREKRLSHNNIKEKQQKKPTPKDKNQKKKGQ
jgi:hypothetical protein